MSLPAQPAQVLRPRGDGDGPSPLWRRAVDDAAVRRGPGRGRQARL